ncbi:MAG: ferrochelatase [Gammaproteobacteria bacterium]|nr:ferrochelatase [Gammaproteobacteria bacterium]
MIGILLTNIGTPDAPTPAAVKKYLKSFLTDKRVVEIPQIIWRPILNGFILPLRSKRSAKLYSAIWTPEGSPLLIHSQNIAEKLQQKLQYPVELGMHYSNPSIPDALKKLHQQNVSKIIVLPLFPQYSATSTASTFDQATKALHTWRNLPEIFLTKDYADNPNYIRAIAHSIQATWKTHGQKFLVFSYHGIPKRYVDLGDPYAERCQLTTELIVRELNLTTNDYAITFQSRLGKTEWLTPYTDVFLKSLPQKGIKDIHVICPGFAVDCLETLEEIALRGKEQFIEHGGKSFHYIPALNDTEAQIELLVNLVQNKS